MEHCGIRIIEPELFDGYDPSKKRFLHQVAIDRDMAPIECSGQNEAQAVIDNIGAENAHMIQAADGTWMVQLLKGATLYVPRALRFDRFVAGQIPTGWNAERLGVSTRESGKDTLLFALRASFVVRVGLSIACSIF